MTTVTIDPFTDASEAAKTVWQDTVTVDPPLTVEERLDAVLAAYAAALAASGCLIVPELAPTAEELDATAVWLAEQSGHHRYWDGWTDDTPGGTPTHDGWRELRQHPRHVEIAYNNARARAIKLGDNDQLTTLIAARRLLLNACEQAVEERR